MLKKSQVTYKMELISGLNLLWVGVWLVIRVDSQSSNFAPFLIRTEALLSTSTSASFFNVSLFKWDSNFLKQSAMDLLSLQ